MLLGLRHDLLRQILAERTRDIVRQSHGFG